MNDLPVPTISTDQKDEQYFAQEDRQPVSVSPSGKEGGSFSVESKGELPLTPVGHEVDIPKEVEQIGVKVHETTVPLPQTVSDQGVESVKHNVPPHPTSGATITLPLTDEEIESGLKTEGEFSIRWLAQWCSFQMKKMQAALLTNHR
jgi:hypothetical protein